MLGNLALTRKEREFKIIAIPEIEAALVNDPTQSDLLVMVIQSEWALGLKDYAQTHATFLKRIDPGLEGIVR